MKLCTYAMMLWFVHLLGVVGNHWRGSEDRPRLETFGNAVRTLLSLSYRFRIAIGHVSNKTNHVPVPWFNRLSWGSRAGAGKSGTMVMPRSVPCFRTNEMCTYTAVHLPIMSRVLWWKSILNITIKFGGLWLLWCPIQLCNCWDRPCRDRGSQ